MRPEIAKTVDTQKSNTFGIRPTTTHLRNNFAEYGVEQRRLATVGATHERHLGQRLFDRFHLLLVDKRVFVDDAVRIENATRVTQLALRATIKHELGRRRLEPGEHLVAIVLVGCVSQHCAALQTHLLDAVAHPTQLALRRKRPAARASNTSNTSNTSATLPPHRRQTNTLHSENFESLRE